MSTRPFARERLPLAVRRALLRAPDLAALLGRRPRPRTLLALVGALMLLLAGWLWLRDSSLVAVRTVEVSGVSGPQAERVRLALEEAARSMTTLHVRRSALDTAVAPFSLVKRIEVSTSLPHTMRIHVVTNVAVGTIVADGRRVAVTSDGTLLRDLAAPAGLPTIAARIAPVGARVTERATAAEVALLAAAPDALRTHVASVATTRAHGLTVQIAHGPALWFGDSGRLVAKWAAVAAVLAAPLTAGASSIDVSAPERPGVGGLPDGAPASGESDIPTPPPGSMDATSGTTTTPATTTPTEAQP